MSIETMLISLRRSVVVKNVSDAATIAGIPEKIIKKKENV